MNKENFLKYLRMFFGLLGLSAIITEIVTLVSRNQFQLVNFFSYFTVISNVLAVAVLLRGALSPNMKANKSFQLFRGAVALYMLMTGVIFSILLSGLDSSRLTAVPWDNVVLHYIMPIVIVLDWVLLPPKTRIAFSKALIWLIVPVLYVVYSLVRGIFVNWYPYPFLDPSSQGYGAVVLTGAFMSAGVVAATWLLCRVTYKRK